MGAHESKNSSSTMGLLKKGQRGKASSVVGSGSHLPTQPRSSNRTPPKPAVVWPETSVRWQSLYDVYICHCMQSSDTPYATEMVSYLEEPPDTLRCFLPVRDMEVGSPMATEMCLGAQNSHCWVLLLTPDFVKDSWCRYQMHQCLTQAPCSEGRLIPVVLELPYSQYPEEIKHMFAIKGKLHDKSHVFSSVKRAIMTYLTKLVTVTTEGLPSSNSSNSQMSSSGTHKSTSDMSTSTSTNRESTSNSSNQDSTSDMSTSKSTNHESTSDMSTSTSTNQESTSDMSTSTSTNQESTSNSTNQDSTSDMSTSNSTNQESTSNSSNHESTSDSANQDSTIDMSTTKCTNHESTSDMSIGNSINQESTSNMSMSNSTNQESTSKSTNHESISDMSTSNCVNQESTNNSTNHESTSDMSATQRSASNMSMWNSKTQDSSDIYCDTDLLTRSTREISMQNADTQEITRTLGSTNDMSTGNNATRRSTSDMSMWDSSDIYCGTALLTRSTKEMSLSCSTHRSSIDQPVGTCETQQVTEDTICQADHASIKARPRPCQHQELYTDPACRCAQFMNADPRAHCNGVYTSQELCLSCSNLNTSCRSVQATNSDSHTLHSCAGAGIPCDPQAHSNDISKTVTDPTSSNSIQHSGSLLPPDLPKAGQTLELPEAGGNR